jgi:hypothetical protein
MSCIRYIEKSFGAAHMDVIDKANAVCSAYKEQGYDLTLRQLYYQFVSRDWIANKQTEYKRLGGIINDARLAGLLDWDYIVDRTRQLEGPGSSRTPHWRNPAQIIDAVAGNYRINKWADQDSYVEVWIEKDALKGVLESTVLANLVREAVYSYRDDDAWEDKLAQESHEREILTTVSERWSEVEEFLS